MKFTRSESNFRFPPSYGCPTSMAPERYSMCSQALFFPTPINIGVTIFRVINILCKKLIIYVLSMKLKLRKF